MTYIAFVRHGMTDWNITRRAQGQSDIPLNDEGRQQANALATRLQKEKWDLIFSSDLSRAKETADIVANKMKLNVQTDQRLREMHKGETEGTTLEERISRWGSDWESLPLGIENDESVIYRGASFVTEIAETYKGKRILVVSHGALIGLTIKKLIPQTNINEHFSNTSITIIKFNGMDWECELFNCANHVNETG
ncbi:histidine phosphatase family protein [Paenibacillus radicis (ex Gao et al. 2016)]|uniref:Fructose 1,6-bisphosphatase n=1 Tax=Paenibacillus radicis (ex Gao et al. 2016) TaxID=1737354 RepID=A0A917H8G4_9BACL|nr:histidine phosphatase family protein [Paenibacillus radicis (ex Gao et al. 2016)]GGG70539.1 fructose 1,6-bisphosphatase [Paenibacillus radicis (ex Gao et al. 2016)]